MISSARRPLRERLLGPVQAPGRDGFGHAARVVAVAPDSVIIETTGTEEKVEGLLEVLRPHGVLELVRTGRVGMVRGPCSVVIESSQLSRPGRQAPSEDENVSDSV